MTQKIKPIEHIKKQFRRREWLLIDIDRMDESTTTPLTGRLIAHSPRKDAVWKILRQSPNIKRPMIECSSHKLPKGTAIIFNI